MVFAPIGFALEARKLLPSFVERGRQQVNMAKFVGRFAVQQGQNEAGKRVSKFQHQAEAVLSELGLAPAATNGQAQAPVVTPPTVTEVAPTPATPVRSSAAAAELPIADYDSLAPPQVIPRLSGLSESELEAVRSYEVAHRGRKTILGKVSQLTGE